MHQPGSTHLGLGKKLLQRYEWNLFENHQEWTNRPSGEEDWFMVYAAGIPGQVRVFYGFTPVYGYEGDPGRHWVLELEKDAAYTAYFYDPRKGKEYDLGPVETAPDGRWRAPLEPVATDWVLVLETADARVTP